MSLLEREMQMYPKDPHLADYYNLLCLVNHGKNCVRIFKAKSHDKQEVYAIKVFIRNKEGELSPHYLQEKDIVKDIKPHPHVLMYYEFHDEAFVRSYKGALKDCSAIVMEYLPDGDLFDFIVKHPVSEKLARTLFHQIISAVEHLHGLGIAHLDIKPQNFLMCQSGVKLIDFDFSLHMKDQVKGMYGTPGYRAPEFLRGSVPFPEKADIYSLGILLFVLVAGNPPYDEIEEEKDHFMFNKFYDLLRQDPEEFWKAHNGFRQQDGKEEFSREFMELFEQMVSDIPEERPGIELIKKHAWFIGEIYSEEELQQELQNIIPE